MMRWNSTKTYTEEDILRMQQEAINRVHDMQARTQKIGYYDYETEPSAGEHNASPPIEAESRVLPQEQDESDLPVQQSASPQNAGVMNPLSNFHLDNETLLILGLLYLLYNEKADTSLLMALGYLLL